MSLTNEDLAPVPQEKRTWNTWNYAALWISMSLCIPTYMLASSLIEGGMNWWQAILTIFLGNTIVLLPMILNGHAGAKFGIPFPVLARASFGGCHRWRLRAICAVSALPNSEGSSKVSASGYAGSAAGIEICSHPQIPRPLSLQPRDREAEPYQISQFLGMFGNSA